MSTDILDSLRNSLVDITHITTEIPTRGPESCEKDLYDRLVSHDLSCLYCNASLCLEWVTNTGLNLAESTTSSESGPRTIAVRLLSDFLTGIVRTFVGGKRLVRQKRKSTGVAYFRPAMINDLRETERLMIGKRWCGSERLLNVTCQLLQQTNTLLNSHCANEKIATCLRGASSCLLHFAIGFENLLGDPFERKKDQWSLQADELNGQLSRIQLTP